jgi:hypothetical protein
MGVQLTPLKARIFDAIRLNPGISRKELCQIIYSTVTAENILTIASHVQQIRDAFRDTTVTVRGKPWGGYVVVTRRANRFLEG